MVSRHCRYVPLLLYVAVDLELVQGGRHLWVFAESPEEQP